MRKQKVVSFPNLCDNRVEKIREVHRKIEESIKEPPFLLHALSNPGAVAVQMGYHSMEFMDRMDVFYTFLCNKWTL
jgi:hypothetical protein